MSKDIIPIHRLDDRTDQGFEVDRVHASNWQIEDAILLGTHRDDHYIFLIQEKGLSKLMVDFSYFILKGRSAVFILPSQVHRYVEKTGTTEGWYLALDAGLVPDMFRATLEDCQVRQPLSLSETDLEMLANCLQLIYTVSGREPVSQMGRQASYGLLNSFVALITELYMGKPEAAGGQPGRPVLISREFRKLLLLQYKICKSPAAYASSLNISLSYLNESVKAITGSSVSSLIQQEVMLEAKRLLYHSDCSVKEIAHELGYEDHTYFSRLFKKSVGITPGEFRRRYRE
jgi:AraC-like DNA-binding protein